MNEVFEKISKIAYFLVVMAIILCCIFPGMYMGSYKLINMVDSSIYARYATNEKFEENIFFNDEIESETKILEQLLNEMHESSEVERIQDFARIISTNQDKVKKVISNNQRYQEYLIDIGSSLDDLIQWSEKISLIDNNLSMTCLYLSFLIIAVVMVVPFGFRKAFYVCAGVTYTIAMLSMFSDGISDYLVANAISLMAKLSSDVFTYRDMGELKSLFSQTYKESTLTFIIFDTVIQMCQNTHNENKEKAIRYLQRSIEIQCSYLSQFKNENNAYIAKLRVPFGVVVRICDKEIRKNNKKIRKKKVSDNIRADLEKENKYFLQLKELLLYICYANCNEHTTKEYISFLYEIQELMYKCKIV